jgi:hypothetical protein
LHLDTGLLVKLFWASGRLPHGTFDEAALPALAAALQQRELTSVGAATQLVRALADQSAKAKDRYSLTASAAAAHDSSAPAGREKGEKVGASHPHTHAFTPERQDAACSRLVEFLRARAQQQRQQVQPAQAASKKKQQQQQQHHHHHHQQQPQDAVGPEMLRSARQTVEIARLIETLQAFIALRWFSPECVQLCRQAVEEERRALLSLREQPSFDFQLAFDLGRLEKLLQIYEGLGAAKEQPRSSPLETGLRILGKFFSPWGQWNQ